MRKVQHSMWLAYSPQTIYECLTNPDALAAVVGRIAAVRVVEREGESGRVAVTLDFPMGKVVETAGEVQGNPHDQLTFTTHDPFPLEFIWQLKPHENGTQVHASLAFDLSVLGIPVPGAMVEGVIRAELQDDLERLQNYLAQHQPNA